jgi:hypothetical protein
MVRQTEEAIGRRDIVGEGNSRALARKGDTQQAVEVMVFLLSPQSSFVRGLSFILIVPGVLSRKNMPWLCHH